MQNWYHQKQRASFGDPVVVTENKFKYWRDPHSDRYRDHALLSNGRNQGLVCLKFTCDSKPLRTPIHASLFRVSLLGDESRASSSRMVRTSKR